MRAILAASVVVGALVLAAVAQGGGRSGPTRAQLELMPLPRSAYGALVAGVKGPPSAHQVPNEDAGQSRLDARLGVAELERLGRVTGYVRRFEGAGDPSGDHLVNALTEADLFRTNAGAQHFVELESEAYRRMEGKRVRLQQLVIDRVSHFAVPGLADARGIRARMDFGGVMKETFTIAYFRVGNVVGVVGLLRVDERDLRPDIARLARALDRRIRDVIAGRIR